ncbi:hypothetical protein SFUMM280S_09091 [Streptomyces fumanus]
MTRAGSVVMNRPVMVSAPARSAGRPETVVPKHTSRPPPERASSSAQAPWTRVLRVSRWRRAKSVSRAVPAASSRCDSQVPDRAAAPGAGLRSYGSGVGTAYPARAVFQCSSAAAPSRPASQAA